jgi:hypothetical protein
MGDGMDKRKRTRIRRSGWGVGSATDFLKLSRAEAARVEELLKVPHSAFRRTRKVKKTFFELADRLATSSDVSEQKRLKRELARMTYGE